MQDLTTPAGAFKAFYSTVLLIWSIILIAALIAEGQSKLADEVSPALAYVLWIGAIGWLTMVEGGQGSLVGLAPVHYNFYKATHPKSYLVTKVCHEGDNLDRYLMGRQLMVVFIVFTVNISAGPLEGAEIWGLPEWVIDTFLGSGLAMILMTAMVGQLNSQVNASLCMLDYINNSFALFTFWVAMAIEFSGLLHSSYLIAIIVSMLAGKPIETKEEPRTTTQSIFFWSRVLVSLAILAFCFYVTIFALFEGKTTLWDGVNTGAALVIFFFLVSVVGMLEGMQIAFFAVAKLKEDERGDGVWAKKTCALLFKGNGSNLPGFMIGRQLMVVSCMFFVARVTSVVAPEDNEDNMLGVSDSMQKLFETGLLGALIVTIVGSIAWQLVASAFPIAFLSTPITYILLSGCLFLEFIGICSGAWVLAAIHRNIAGFQRDEVYIGTAEERALKNLEDKETLHGALAKLPGFAESAPKQLKKLIESDPAVAEYVKDYMETSMRSMQDAEKGVAEGP